MGNPLDTLLIMDSFGTRKHPIFGTWQLHSGIDLIDTYKDTVYATASGISTMATWNAGYGKCIVLKHAHGYSSKYAHLKGLIKGHIKNQFIKIYSPEKHLTTPQKDKSVI